MNEATAPKEGIFYTIYGPPTGWHVVKPRDGKYHLWFGQRSHGDLCDDEVSPFMKMLGLGEEF